MASSYDISGGDSEIEILRDSDNTSVNIQIISTSSLDADITVNLLQSSNGDNYETLTSTVTIASGENSILIETNDFTLDILYLNVVVGSATVGTINWFLNSKKKADSVTETNPVLNSTSFDAFARLRVSQVSSQADLKQIHDELPLIYDIEEINGGTHAHSTSNAESTLSTSSNTDAVVMQTKQRFNYSSGKSSLLYITFKNFKTQTNIIKRIGYFNSSTTTPFTATRDGLALENDEGVINFVISKSGTNTKYERSTWDDPLDGTGASGVDLDLGGSNGNLLLFIDFEWLGVGQVRYGFIKDGTYYVANLIDFIMDTGGVYMSSPNHSIRAEIRQSGSGSGNFKLICATYGSEGATNILGKDGAIDDDGTHLDANSTSEWYYAIGIRLQAAKTDTLVDILQGFLLSVTNDKFLYRILFNPTYASTVTYTDVTDYSVSYGLGATANTITDDGYILRAGGGESNSIQDFDVSSAVRLGANIDGTLDEMVIAIKPLSSNADIHRGINWRELS